MTQIKETSLEAYMGIFPELGERQREVLETLKRMGEANNNMLSREMKIPINSITPRILELRELGLVVESYVDKCPITKRRSSFWRAK